MVETSCIIKKSVNSRHKMQLVHVCISLFHKITECAYLGKQCQSNAPVQNLKIAINKV